MEKIDICRKVLSVNNIKPDENGNVYLNSSGGSFFFKPKINAYFGNAVASEFTPTVGEIYDGDKWLICSTSGALQNGEIASSDRPSEALAGSMWKCITAKTTRISEPSSTGGVTISGEKSRFEWYCYKEDYTS